jgi:hypothetical protein
MSAAPGTPAHLARQWDVHTYTSELRRRVEDWTAHPDLHPEAQHWITPCAASVADIIAAKYADHAVITATITKMKGRTNTAIGSTTLMYPDPDILGVNIWGILASAVLLASTDASGSLDELLRELLVDAGTTCIQGDSHRLLMFIFAACDDIDSRPAPSRDTTPDKE